MGYASRSLAANLQLVGWHLPQESVGENAGDSEGPYALSPGEGR